MTEKHEGRLIESYDEKHKEKYKEKHEEKHEEEHEDCLIEDNDEKT